MDPGPSGVERVWVGLGCEGQSQGEKGQLEHPVLMVFWAVLGQSCPGLPTADIGPDDKDRRHYLIYITAISMTTPDSLSRPIVNSMAKWPLSPHHLGARHLCSQGSRLP